MQTSLTSTHKFILGTLFTLILTGCPEPDNPIYTCATDSDCPGSQRCDLQQNICTAEISNCGDGLVTGLEQCDPESDEDLCPYNGSNCLVCTAECTTEAAIAPRCGDEVVQPEFGEECDNGENPVLDCDYGLQSCQVCSAQCQLVEGKVSTCGDLVVDAEHEECDEGDSPEDTCAYGQTSCQVCSTGCNLTAGTTSYCGDFELDPNGREKCDEGPDPDQDCAYGERNCQVCSLTCDYTAGNTRYCGDGMRTDSEECDPGSAQIDPDCAYGEESCMICNENCNLVAGNTTGFCGDGVVQEDHELCDGQTSLAGSTCEDVANLHYGTPSCTDTCSVDVDACFGTSMLALGGQHSCALLSSGKVRCWGDNIDGQLGTGTTTSSLAPVEVPGLTDIVQISSGAAHTCALNQSNEVYCWGNNTQGQIGTGNTLTQTTPQRVTGLPNSISSIAVGNFSSCALDTTGDIYCWGDNRFGALGFDSMGNMVTQPTKADLTGATAIAAGGGNTCAIKSGEVHCWGDLLTSVSPDTPWMSAEIQGASNITQISVGLTHACALSNNNAVLCWGANFAGQLGTNDMIDSAINAKVTLKPSGSQQLSSIVEIKAGGFFSCAISSLDKVYCWGQNGQGQLGINTGQDQLRPVELVTLNASSTATLGLGTFHACRASESGQVDCWGENQSGQLGNGQQNQGESLPVSTTGW